MASPKQISSIVQVKAYTRRIPNRAKTPLQKKMEASFDGMKPMNVANAVSNAMTYQIHGKNKTNQGNANAAAIVRAGVSSLKKRGKK